MVTSVMLPQDPGVVKQKGQVFDAGEHVLGSRRRLFDTCGGGAFGQFGGIDPVSVYDPLYGPSALSPYGQHWIATTKVNYAWAIVGYDPNNPPAVNLADPDSTIAIIDTGIDSNHPEFFGDEEFPSKIHPDSRTFVEGGQSFPPIIACPCESENYSVEDLEDTLWLGVPGGTNPHGTISAGIAAAYAGNGEGIAGVCWECPLLVLRVSAFIENTQADCEEDLEGCWYSEQSIADAIKYAAGWNPDDDTWGSVRARVISTAITTVSVYDDVCDTTNLIAQAVDEAYARGCVIVAIAGNAESALSTPCWSASDPDDPNCEPAGTWTPQLISHGLSLNPKTITVGGTCRTGAAWHCQSMVNPPIGNLGACGPSLYPIRPLDNTAPAISVVAPIEEMVATTAYDEGSGQGALYGFLNELNSGTSWAGPQVAGVAALMLKMNPALTPWQVKKIIEVTATDIDAIGYDPRTGHGLLNARAAVEYVMKQQYPADWNGDGNVETLDAALYITDYSNADAMTDLNLDDLQTADDMSIFLDSYAGQ